ncbi:MAG: transposase [Holophagales bacterium]|nr:transposase [Holophagales bacterium]MYD20769.1 transposase [Holophagales bacterium]MYI33662.1 transposase [Holophagales bacterium]
MSRPWTEGSTFCVLPSRSPRIDALNRCLEDFNHHYNRQRPHQALGGLTPWQYLQSTAA